MEVQHLLYWVEVGHIDQACRHPDLLSMEDLVSEMGHTYDIGCDARSLRFSVLVEARWYSLAAFSQGARKFEGVIAERTERAWAALSSGEALGSNLKAATPAFFDSSAMTFSAS